MSVATISAIEFKAKRVDLLDRLAERRLERVEVTKRWLRGGCPRDPGDRLLIAAARHLKMAIVTRDSRIATYATQRLVRLIGC